MMYNVRFIQCGPAFSSRTRNGLKKSFTWEENEGGHVEQKRHCIRISVSSECNTHSHVYNVGQPTIYTYSSLQRRFEHLNFTVICCNGVMITKLKRRSGVGVELRFVQRHFEWLNHILLLLTQLGGEGQGVWTPYPWGSTRYPRPIFPHYPSHFSSVFFLGYTICGRLN